MRKPFAVGERVVVRYATASWHGTPPQGFEARVARHPARVLAVSGDVILVEWEKPLSGRNVFLSSQCRRLVKRKAREWDLECTELGWRVARYGAIKSRIGETVTVREARPKREDRKP